MTFLEKLYLYFQYPFVIYAMIAGTMIALCSSLLGVTLVLRRFSFIGDSLSHTAFGCICVATVLKITTPVYFVLPLTVIAAVIILCGGKNSKVKGDANLAMVSAGSLAVGYLLMNLFAPPSNLSADVCSTLFGSTLILTLKKSEVILSVVLSISVVLFFILNYNRIFALTFDQEFAFACGTKTRLYNFLTASFTAVIIVLAMNLVGSLLISALIIFPSVTSLQLFKSFKSVTVASCIFSVTAAVFGITAAVIFGTPVGPTVVASNIIFFLCCKTVSIVKNKLQLKFKEN